MTNTTVGIGVGPAVRPQPVPTGTPKVKPVPTGKPKVKPVPIGRPKGTPVPTGEPKATLVPTGKPIGIDGKLLLSPQQVILGKHIEKVFTGPKGTPVPTGEPKATLVPTGKPIGTPVPTDKLKVHPVPTGNPKFTPVPTSRLHRPFPVATDRGCSPLIPFGIDGKLLLSPQQVILGKHIEKETPFAATEDEGIFNSGCSRSMTGNKDRLDDFQAIHGGKVTFGGGEGRITGKGTIRTPTLDFENVYYVKELQQFNL
nr:ribonuclease H-like domain-containing protein [Tanacetum cinerariifolium]